MVSAEVSVCLEIALEQILSKLAKLAIAEGSPTKTIVD